MKKFIISITLLVSMFVAISPVAQAADAADVAMFSLVGVEGAKQLYDATVISEIYGRAGSSTAAGACGNVFEVLLRDKMNLKNFFKPGVTTKLSTSSIDPFADLVTIDACGETLEFIQCKDGLSMSQAYKVEAQMAAGKYDGATLMGTKEFANNYNPLAEKAGLPKAVDSGISNETTTRLANKSLGIPTEPAALLKASGKLGTIGFCIGALAALCESLERGDDFYQATGNILTDANTTAITLAIIPVVEEGVTVFLTAVGITGTAATFAPAVIGVLVPCAAGYVLCMGAEAIGLEDTIANVSKEVVTALASAADDVAAYVESLNIPEYGAQAWDAVRTTGVNAGHKVAELANNAASAVGTFTTDTVDSIEASEFIQNLSEIAETVSGSVSDSVGKIFA